MRESGHEHRPGQRAKQASKEQHSDDSSNDKEQSLAQSRPVGCWDGGGSKGEWGPYADLSWVTIRNRVHSGYGCDPSGGRISPTRQKSPYAGRSTGYYTSRRIYN